MRLLHLVVCLLALSVSFPETCICRALCVCVWSTEGWFPFMTLILEVCVTGKIWSSCKCCPFKWEKQNSFSFCLPAASFSIVLVSGSCGNKLPKTAWLKTREIYHCRIQETRGPKGVNRVGSFWRALRENCSIPHLLLVAAGSPELEDTLFWSRAQPSHGLSLPPGCFCVSSFSVTPHWFRTHSKFRMIF